MAEFNDDDLNDLDYVSEADMLFNPSIQESNELSAAQGGIGVGVPQSYPGSLLGEVFKPFIQNAGGAEMEDRSGASRPRLGSTNQCQPTSVNSTTGAGSSQVDRGLTATGVSSPDLTTVGTCTCTCIPIEESHGQSPQDLGAQHAKLE